MSVSFRSGSIQEAAKDCWENGLIPSPSYMASPEELRLHALPEAEVASTTLAYWVDEAERLSDSNLKLCNRLDYISTGIAFGAIVSSAYALTGANKVWDGFSVIHKNIPRYISDRFSDMAARRCESSDARSVCEQRAYDELVGLNHKQQLIDVGSSLFLTAVFAYSAWKCRKLAREYNSRALHLRELSGVQLMQSWHAQDVLDERNNASVEPS